MALASSLIKTSMALQCLPASHSERLFVNRHRPATNLVLPPHLPPRHVLAFSRRRTNNSAVTSSSSSPKKKKCGFQCRQQSSPANEREEDVDEDAFEALFDILEEDLKNDGASVDDDEDISEEDLEKLQRELEEAFGDIDDEGRLNSASGDMGREDNAEEDSEKHEEEEEPLKLKNWQLRRLARALRTGRRKTSIKSLAAELCLDRAVVLELLRDPPPNLVMMSAALPDHESAPTILEPETKPVLTVPEEGAMDTVKSETEEKLPVHVRQQRWFAQKRLKKVQVETLERVYRRTKRPTNAIINSIVQVVNLPRKKVVKWFEDKRTDEGVPDRRLPYQRSVSESVFSH
ncbi:protein OVEREXPRESSOR OF CATIONIC PEROXIDASE 3-like isoform X1 [Tripterygium wilfordii]|uniref:protein OVEREXPRESSOR OF CATIONIC PEROXIDASE 3-like isoform X1 n=1 Tax=Tripterygium wilfordii TaxID=458696 RepID=UPI0018F82FE9|nr:protein OVEREXPRESSOR OF CATIONIC PEROXIDASE 3-like isoform X1 [Tripterygium wilfordii]